jgi:acyl carrier protein
MLQRDALNWLMNWFQERNHGLTIDTTDNYYEKGLIDSFGIVELISEIEDSLEIYLDDEDLRSSEFRTIEGLSKIIISRKKEKS